MHDNDADPNDLPDANPPAATPLIPTDRHARRVAAAQHRKDATAVLRRATLAQSKVNAAKRAADLAVARGAKLFNREVERGFKAREDEMVRREAMCIFGH